MAATLENTRLRSEETYRSLCQVTPYGVNSPVRAFSGLLETPLVAESGFGDKIVDVDGNTYLDYCCSWGALIHGHAHPLIVEAAQKRVAMGSSFGLTTPSEEKLAKLIVGHVPSVEKIRFVSSGTEATMSAARLARGFTKRDLLVKFSGHYHGHAESFLIQAGSGAAHLPSSGGVPSDFIQHTLCLPYNDFEACERAFQEYGKAIAAIIVEPVAANMGLVLPKEGFLEMLRIESLKSGSLLIFDEVITGFRLALGGAQELFGIKPDLTCFGKIIGGGFPAAAFGGKAEIMECLAPGGNVYQAGTLSGNPVAMEAGFQAVSLCESPGFYESLEKKTSIITAAIEEFIEENALNLCINQVGSLFTIFFGNSMIENIEHVKKCDKEAFKRFFRLLFDNGIYLSPSQFEANFVSSAHSEESLIQTRDLILESLEQLV